MNILIISGFLGSGKTTLLLNIAKKLIADSLQIAIIENEIGDIGIDGNYLKQEGLTVQELFGGCICCTLTSGLIETLRQVYQQYHPNRIIIEATGAARPGDIVTTLHDPLCPLDIDFIKVITVVDATRYDMLMEMMQPLITAQIECADIVAVNKIDAIDASSLQSILIGVNSLNSTSMNLSISAEKPDTLITLMESI